jgi:hypothetical protein
MKKYTVEITKLDENSNYFDRKHLYRLFLHMKISNDFFHRATEAAKKGEREREMVMQTAY